MGEHASYFSDKPLLHNIVSMELCHLSNCTACLNKSAAEYKRQWTQRNQIESYGMSNKCLLLFAKDGRLSDGGGTAVFRAFKRSAQFICILIVFVCNWFIQMFEIDRKDR